MNDVGKGDLKTLANGLFPSGQDVAALTPEGRDEIRDAIEVILKLWDYRNARLALALEGLDKAADEIVALRSKLAEYENVPGRLRHIMKHGRMPDEDDPR